MFGIGTWELVLILILALILLGPDKLPGMARSVGRSLTKLRRTADEVRRDMDLDGLQQDIRSSLFEDPELEQIQRDLDVRSDIRRAMHELQDPPPLPGPGEASTAAAPADRKQTDAPPPVADRPDDAVVRRSSSPAGPDDEPPA